MKIAIFLYAVLLICLSVFSYVFIDPNLIYLERLYSGIAFEQRGFVSLAYIAIVLASFVFYLYFLKRINQALLPKTILVSVLLLIFSYPAMLSYDIFNYIATSKVLYFYHENPFIIMPVEFLGDPLLLFTRAANKVALYGPAWIGLISLPFLLGFGNFILTLFNFKLLAVLFYIGISYLILKITKDPKKVAFFALNPLVLIETLVSGHNDVVMMFFALLSIYFLIKNKTAFSIVFLVISVLIKYATIFLLPVFIYYFFLKIKKKKIDRDKIFMLSAVLMFAIFFLSPLREEIYPWYGIWFITFVSLIPKYKLIRLITFLLSFVLLLRYVPFMYFGTYFGLTPVIKIIITFVPLLGLFALYLMNQSPLFRKIRRPK